MIPKPNQSTDSSQICSLTRPSRIDPLFWSSSIPFWPTLHSNLSEKCFIKAAGCYFFYTPASTWRPSEKLLSFKGLVFPSPNITAVFVEPGGMLKCIRGFLDKHKVLNTPGYIYTKNLSFACRQLEWSKPALIYLLRVKWAPI